ncbi:MAG: 3-hydroxyacyl-CoA dehydrogenase/enoyl-CoA hydratase family protein [Candidatus Krumholzibacteria bacterium]|nr:3-hydroxyacyl-CoA dehydrogenase/enoyl-CoA hydratase family protein [Candidatus Krumholzibacteria bacterium]
MRRQIRKVAVLGSGVMGSGIAAHFANAGIPSLVLDIVPRELTPKEEAAGLALDHPRVRNRIATDSVAALKKTRPSPIYSTEMMSLIEVGNFEDDLAKLKDVDWIIEVVKEDMAIKKIVLGNVAPHVGPETIFTSNTSGLSLAEMSAVLPAEMRPRFMGTHFFNPPRYMKLFEVIPTADTDPELLEFVCDFARERLGKGIVLAKDTPNFIANRVGVHAMMAVIQIMGEMDLTIEEIDSMTGPAIGRPKTATFKLADLVGLDTFLHVADNIYPLIPDDEARETFVVPDVVRQMVAKGLLGRKSGAGFYKMTKTDEGKKVLTLDLETLEFREKQSAKLGEIAAAKAIEDLPQRLKTLAFGKGKAGQAIWKMLSATFSYSAMRLGEICDQAADIDQAVCWGFNWDLGPFQVWDAIGFRKVTERMKAENLALPAWVDALYDSGAENIYRTEGGVVQSPTAEPGVYADLPTDERIFDFDILRANNREVKRNPGASLLDLGDGVLGLEFHSKMNAIGQDTLNMVMTACTEAEKNWQALVVTNLSDNFSVGANLMMLMMEAMEGNWDDINMIIRAFQTATSRLEHCGVPVVTAPAGLALGGGCEMTMGANSVRAAAETYIGLVEFGAGVIPAGGGCLRLYQRNVDALMDKRDLQPAFRKTFETIGTAKVATSAAEAVELGFLRPGDSWSLNRDHLAADAKDLALAMATSHYVSPVEDQAIPVMGTAGIALAESVLFNMEQGGFVSAHDRKIGMELAKILAGGVVPPGTTVTEKDMLDLERESFMRLLGERKTLERMEHILKTGKPLRN